MKFIKLKPRGKVIIDDDDYLFLNSFRWYLHHSGNGRFYQRTHIRQSPYCAYMHRMIMGFPENMEIDHINGNSTDNRKSNLRIVSRAQNACNLLPRKGKRFKGVYWQKQFNRWVARIQVGGKRKHLAISATAKEAARAYDNAATQLHGRYARLNFL